MIKDFDPFELVSPFADNPTTLFEVRNSKLNCFFVLAKSKAHALEIVEYYGHVINRKFARTRESDATKWSPEMAKFFSSAAQVAAKRAQGIVTNQNGFALMKHGGQIYMPLSLVTN